MSKVLNELKNDVQKVASDVKDDLHGAVDKVQKRMLVPGRIVNYVLPSGIYAGQIRPAIVTQLVKTLGPAARGSGLGGSSGPAAGSDSGSAGGAGSGSAGGSGSGAASGSGGGNGTGTGGALDLVTLNVQKATSSDFDDSVMIPGANGLIKPFSPATIIVSSVPYDVGKKPGTWHWPND